jgi:hypothetical protein
MQVPFVAILYPGLHAKHTDPSEGLQTSQKPAVHLISFLQTPPLRMYPLTQAAICTALKTVEAIGIYTTARFADKSTSQIIEIVAFVAKHINTISRDEDGTIQAIIRTILTLVVCSI